MKNVIVITGIGGCGKTSFSAALAAKFAREGYGTLLISPDTHVPAFGLWVPTEKPQISLGKILEERSFDPEAVASAVFIHRGLNENLGLISFLKDEKSDHYSPASKNEAATFLRTASELADITIVDGTCYGDMLTTSAVEASALQVRLLEPTVRGFLFEQSRPPEKADGKSIWVACPWQRSDPVDAVMQGVGVLFAAIVPYSQEAHEKSNKGHLFEPYQEKHYRAAVERVALAVKEAIA